MIRTASFTAEDFARRVLRWGKRSGRHGLPWQGTRDPYRIWLAEVMLQQTRVDTVIPYYLRFLARFPDLASLARASLEEVLGLWSGLGYYARARKLHEAARRIVQEHGGRFPRGAAGIALLPGLGRSSAAAIAAFAFGERAAILDGNVRRVLCRAYGIEGYPGRPEVARRLWALTERLTPARQVGAYTQALMDLGATVCVRARPACERCPLAPGCVAAIEGRSGELPAPRPRSARPERTSRMLVLLDGDRVMLERRPPAGIWGGLLCLPELPEAAAPGPFCSARLGCGIGAPQPLPAIRHGFTHLRLVIEPLLARVETRTPRCAQDGLVWLAPGELARAGLPAPIRRLLAQLPQLSSRPPAAPPLRPLPESAPPRAH
ncbi:MAG: A/G-specific adenine glycosylase [Rhodocyclaceae bacterium]